MSFIQEKFSENEEIFCLYGNLNLMYLYQPLMNKQILLNSMDNSYSWWIHHGESLDVYVIEYPIDVHNNGDGFIHEECVKEDYSGDRLEGVLGEL
jgi:hypothetical protein